MTNLRIAGAAAATLLALMPPTAQPTRQALSGDLTKPLAQYTGDEFFALVRGLRYGQGADKDRHCRGNPACGGARRVSVRADAVADADSLSGGNLAANGVVAARVINNGGDTENRYNMEPASSGRRAYFLVVLPAAGGAATWALEELDVQGNTRTHRTVSTGRLTGCNHPFVRGAKADFKTCAAARGGAFQMASFDRSMQEDDPPLWIGCASGCCTADSRS